MNVRRKNFVYQKKGVPLHHETKLYILYIFYSYPIVILLFKG